MKRILFALSIGMMAWLTPIEACAQGSMTDKQVLEYVKQQTKAGKSQQSIASELLQRGATTDQLQRLRRKYMTNNGTEVDEDRVQREERRRNNTPRKSSTSSRDEDDDNISTRENRSGSGFEDQNEDEYEELYTTGYENYDGSERRRKVTGSSNRRVQQREDRKIFGHDIFRQRSLSFEPNVNIATPDSYVLGAGDEVYIDIYGASQQTIKGKLSPEGSIGIDGIGPVTLANMTVAQANDHLRRVVGPYYESSQIRLTVGDMRSIQVNVMGEVSAPGTYTLPSLSSVFHALYQAGGVTKIGTLRDVKVYRGGKLLTSVDIYDFILNGRLSGSIGLKDDDVIIVGPYANVVEIEGRVKRPMFYEMRADEHLSDLLTYAGGLEAGAYSETLRVLRKSGARYAVYNVRLDDMAQFMLTNGDRVEVDSVVNRYENMVELRGAAFHPGLYELGGNITTVRQLVSQSGGLKEQAIMQHAILYRMHDDRSTEAISIDLEGIMNGTSQDMPLHNEDVLLVPSFEERQLSQYLTIYGEVYYPGTYKYSKGETLEAFILQAGGLTEAASTVKVDVARRIFDAQATIDIEDQAQVFSFTLNNGLVIEGESDFTLMPYDEVYVRRSPLYNESQNVTLSGEVLFSGPYALSKKTERLSDIIARAGGLTKQAYTSGAKLVRRMSEDERERAMLMLEQIESNSEDSVSTKKIDIKTNYTIGIDLAEAMRHPGSDADIVLRDGDEIVIPRLNNTVKINGEVFYPNTVSYCKGKSASYYINQAGGFSNNAKKRKAYIIYQNGQVARVSKGAKPEPGCEIVVPSKPVKRPVNMVQWTGIATSLATIAALVISVTK